MKGATSVLLGVKGLIFITSDVTQKSMNGCSRIFYSRNRLIITKVTHSNIKILRHTPSDSIYITLEKLQQCNEKIYFGASWFMLFFMLVYVGLSWFMFFFCASWFNIALNALKLEGGRVFWAFKPSLAKVNPLCCNVTRSCREIIASLASFLLHLPHQILSCREIIEKQIWLHFCFICFTRPSPAEK